MDSQLIERVREALGSFKLDIDMKSSIGWTRGIGRTIVIRKKKEIVLIWQEGEELVVSGFRLKSNTKLGKTLSTLLSTKGLAIRSQEDIEEEEKPLKPPFYRWECRQCGKGASIEETDPSFVEESICESHGKKSPDCDARNAFEVIYCNADGVIEKLSALALVQSRTMR